MAGEVEALVTSIAAGKDDAGARATGAPEDAVKVAELEVTAAGLATGISVLDKRASCERFHAWLNSA